MLKFFQKDTRKKNFLFFLFFACSWQHRYCSACKRTSAQDTEDQVCILTPPCQFSLSSPHRHTSPGISRWGIWRALNLSRCGKAHVSRRRQKPCVCCRPAVCRNGIAGFSPYIYSMISYLWFCSYALNCFDSSAFLDSKSLSVFPRCRNRSFLISSLA